MNPELMERGMPTAATIDQCRTYDQKQRFTMEAINHPRPGDRFHEMYSFWIIVTGVTDKQVVYWKGNPPCTFPTKNVSRHVSSREKYRKSMVYDSMPDTPTMMLAARDEDGSWADTP